MPKRPKRVGKTRTFGISVDSETEKFLREEADARFEGNVSRLVSALAREEMGRRAAEWVLLDSPDYEPMTDDEKKRFLAQFTRPRKRRKRSAA